MRNFLSFLPAVRLLGCAVVGILLAAALQVTPVAWLVLFCMAVLTLIGLLLGERFRRPPAGVPVQLVLPYLVVVTSAFALYASSRFAFVPSPSLISWVGKDAILSGEVEGRPESAHGGLGFRLRVREVFHAGRRVVVDDRVQVFVKLPAGNGLKVEEGEFVRVKGRPGLIAPASNLGEYDMRRHSRYRQLHVQMFCSGPWCLLREAAGKAGGIFGAVVNPARRYLAGSIDSRFPQGREQQFVKGMILGEQELLPEELGEAFRRTGTAHVIAVSGLHVALLALAVNLFLQRLNVTTVGRWVAFVLFVTVLAVYCFVTGNAPSIRRAAIMSAVMIGGGVLGRKTFAVNSLAVSDLLILLFDPFDLFNAGFLMTNGAVLGILTLHPPLSALVPSGGRIARHLLGLAWSAFCVGIAAMAGVGPVIAFFFGTFSVSGIVANLPVVFFSNLAMYSALPLFAFHGVAAWPASLFALSSWAFAKLTLFFTILFSQMPMASLELRPDLLEVAVLYATLAALMLFMGRRSWGQALVALLVGANLLLWREVWRPVPKPPSILTVNLGRDVGILFSSGSETVVIDAGRRRTTWPRILRQADAWGFARPVAVVGVFSPDTVVQAVPVPHCLASGDRSLVLHSAVVTRLTDRVVRIDSRRRSLLLVSGMGRLMETPAGRVDVAMIWMYRFTGKQFQELDAWLDSSRPGKVLLIPGSFMPAAQRELLRRYAATRKGVMVRSKTVQARF
ncbi:MAG: ComEC family competence protein [Chlorobiaceae bacterium]|nr:ComEC family competence protein [Chlorobiaceae bacterium]